MSFILLRRTTDGEIHLLSNAAWSGRGDAMAELSRITAAPTFDCWDDEVLLVDMDSGTPILMVRPAAPEPEVEVLPDMADEPEAVEETEPATANEAEAELESETEVAASDDDAPDAQDAVTDDAVDESPAADEDPATPESSTDDEIDALLEGLDAPEAAPTAAPSLKEALARSTARLEAEGIVAPESIGPAPDPSTVDAEDAGEPEAVADEAPAAWPWDTAAEEKKFDLDAFEESQDECGSLVRAPGDDETLSFAKPVILGGEYADTAPEAAPEPEPEATPAQEADSAGSDFIDLGPAEQAAPAPMASDEIQSLTCADCVYDATCPNRGQLLPASCGSFQWK